MHCKSCDYSLWNIRSRTCPECGEPFRPSEFEFNPNRVRFCCPHCEQVYYGTDERGHLEPPEFDCLKCGRHIHMDDTVLRPAEGLDDRSTTIPPTPWRQRDRLGFFAAWFRTIGLALIRPHHLFANRVTAPAARPATSFLLVTVALTSLVSLAPYLALIVFTAVFTGGGAAGAVMLTLIALLLAGSLILPIVFALIWALFTHGLLRIFGGAPAHGLSRTYEAIAYSAGTYTTAAIPCLGHYIAPLWWPVSATLAVRTGQRVSGVRASVATLILPVILILAFIGAYATLLAMSFSAGQMRTVSIGQLPERAATERLTDALTANRSAPGGAYPSHAVALVTEQSLDPLSFLVQESGTRPEQTSVGTSTLADFMLADYASQRRLVLEAASALPTDTAAHRVGDFVFAYHGVSPWTDDETAGELWIVICWLDPAQNERPTPNSNISIGRVDGKVIAMPVSAFRANLAAQNERRTAAGLAPLPHPDEITHESPAVAPADNE